MLNNKRKCIYNFIYSIIFTTACPPAPSYTIQRLPREQNRIICSLISAVSYDVGACLT